MRRRVLCPGIAQPPPLASAAVAGVLLLVVAT
jgi:hypothetical protein